jgi:glyoxylase-like metal-dependent hydrolase (beta-lactamase superfamily II)
VYIVEGRDQYVLIDAGSGDQSGFREALLKATNGGKIGTLLLTHSILPHTGNVEVVREISDDIRIVSASTVPEIVGLEGAEKIILNSTCSFASEKFTFLDPLVTDVVLSTWIYHHGSKTLFTAEGVGHFHRGNQCDFFSSDMSEGIPPDNTY